MKFNEAKGSAKSRIDGYEIKNGTNKVRLFGDICCRYVYWINTGSKDIPVEDLSFSREEERFDNKEINHVPDFFPKVKNQWNYAINCLDLNDKDNPTGTPKVFHLKKKLLTQILEYVNTPKEEGGLGDPTDPETGWDIVFKRTKTGSNKFDVEYTLMPLQCKVKPLTDEQKKIIAEEPSITEKYPRPTPDEVLKTLKQLSGEEDDDEDSDESATTDKEAVDDINQ